MSLWWRCLPRRWRRGERISNQIPSWSLNCIYLGAIRFPSHEIRPRNRQGAGAIVADARRGVLPSECHLRG
ncbi:hypothetical protein FIBSPDRAFT_854485 [Athelia psychrophila]|uniref:Uncharacterized protein n=1 Tax=Athelia psychrophila TaxID=1759441 RepID=A0A166Q6H6_9AGAM|nr:hypothetical protein FIBSPDRAFT_854485 [Fibularhizoctonia sp. CBS 109695]